MTKIDIFSGFLGAGKTTLIKKLIKEAYSGEKLVLIENEFGEIGIDGGFLQDAGIEITEMNSGCICCSLVGDFSKALVKVLDEFHPDRVIIEPSGVGKLSDVIKAVRSVEAEDAQLNCFTTVADVNKCKMYMKNFGEFFNDQIENAGCIFFSHTDKTTDAKMSEALSLVRAHNDSATIVTTPATELKMDELMAAFEKKNTLAHQLEKLLHEEECPVCGHHHHHHHDHDEECDCHEHEHHHHHHDHDEECDCHEHEHHHHHHDHDEESDCHEHGHHHHHHDHDEECDCHEHGHHHHHADEVFTSFGRETVKKYAKEDIEAILAKFIDNEDFGMILRAKGIVESCDGKWIHFDYVPGEIDVRFGSASTIGRICVIGSKIKEKELEGLFGVN